jgi:RNA polymerase sigma-70 factor, ECF subfamily
MDPPTALLRLDIRGIGVLSMYSTHQVTQDCVRAEAGGQPLDNHVEDVGGRSSPEGSIDAAASSPPSAFSRRPPSQERFASEVASVRDFLTWKAARLTDQRADAEDLLQETLLKAYLSFETFTEGTHFKSWLTRIMSNAWIDGHRRTQRRPSEKLSAEVSEPLAAAARPLANSDDGQSAEARVLRMLPGEAELALRALPRELREVIYYALIAEYSYTEIAHLLEIPVGTVASRLHRGRTRLRKVLLDSASSSDACLDDAATA